LKKIFSIIFKLYLIIILFLYTYSPEVNLGPPYARHAIVMLYIGISIYLFYSIFIKKNKLIKINTIFDWFMLLFIYYILFESIMYPKSFLTSINISIMIILVFLLIKIFQYNLLVYGREKIENIFEFLFSTFLIFILLSTIVAFLDLLNVFTLFKIPDISQYKRVQSWFSNSTIYGVNIAISIMFSYYFYFRYASKKFLIIIFWLLYWMLMTGGRTALIITVIGILINFIFRYKIQKLITYFIVLITVIFFNFSNLSRSFLMIRRLMNGGFGKRGLKAIEVFNIWLEQNFINKIFGSGIDNLLDVHSFSAHSGFLRLWFDFGLLFVLIYCFFIFFVIKKYIDIIKITDNNDKNLMITGFAVTLMYFFAESMIIITISSIYDFCLLLIIAGLPFIYRRPFKKIKIIRKR